MRKKRESRSCPVFGATSLSLHFNLHENATSQYNNTPTKHQSTSHNLPSISGRELHQPAGQSGLAPWLETPAGLRQQDPNPAELAGAGYQTTPAVEWIRCSNPTCGKWRALPPYLTSAQVVGPTVQCWSTARNSNDSGDTCVDVNTGMPPDNRNQHQIMQQKQKDQIPVPLVGGKWYCVLNYWDESVASCGAPQETRFLEVREGPRGWLRRIHYQPRNETKHSSHRIESFRFFSLSL